MSTTGQGQANLAKGSLLWLVASLAVLAELQGNQSDLLKSKNLTKWWRNTQQDEIEDWQSCPPEGVGHNLHTRSAWYWARSWWVSWGQHLSSELSSWQAGLSELHRRSLSTNCCCVLLKDCDFLLSLEWLALWPSWWGFTLLAWGLIWCHTDRLTGLLLSAGLTAHLIALPGLVCSARHLTWSSEDHPNTDTH